MNQDSLTIRLDDQTLRLCPERCLLWEERRWLILSDLHLGKSLHFQRRGIPLPTGAQEATLDRLGILLDRFRPERVLILGDLFHSRLNPEWTSFAQWRRQWTAAFTLVMGNHDILPEHAYGLAGLELERRLSHGPFEFVHDADGTALETDGLPASQARWTVCGHLHPRAIIRLRGRVTAKRPCFHLRGRILTLPAFGDQTGGHTVRPSKGDRLFVVTDGCVIDVAPVPNISTR